MRLYPNGLGELTGDSLVTSTAPLYLSGAVWWVLSTIGIDAAGAAGQDRERPLATLQQALANASDGDIIVLRDGHVQTVTVAIALTKSITVVAGGRSAAGLPTVMFTLNAPNASLFTVNTISGVELRNILFAENQQTNANTSGKIDIGINAPNTRLIGCYFRCGAADVNQPAVGLSASSETGNRFDAVTFISTATGATRPATGIGGSLASIGTEIFNCVFDDGTVGWGPILGIAPAACLLANTLSSVRILGAQLRNNATIFLGAAAVGYVGVSQATGAAKVIF